ncbi:MAG TPA: hypothetical protein VNM69_06330 [Bacillus sp. (in: firmicutes)]|nr:hypothetical protein [Bacillus sp. (in: firmicutes)]
MSFIRRSVTPLILAQFYNQTESDRRLFMRWIADLQHHRTYRSVYGGSTV